LYWTSVLSPRLFLETIFRVSPMKSRAWVLIVFILLIIIIGGYVAAFRIFNINEKAKDYLTEKISQSLGADFTSNSVSILPWSVRINDISLNLKDSPGAYHDVPLRIMAKRIRIGFNIFTLLKNRFRPVYGTQKIFFDEPEFIWLLDDEHSIVPENGAVSPEQKSGFPIENLLSIRINIFNGSFVFQKGDSTLVFAYDINGWLDGYKTPVIDINVEGKILSEKTNTTCKGFVDKADKKISIDVISNDCNLAFKGIEVFLGDIFTESGILDFDVHFEKINEKSTFNGNYSVSDGSFLLKELDVGVSDLYLKGRLNEHEVFLESVTGNIWDVKPELSGHIKLVPEPYLNLILSADGIDISRALSDIFPEKRVYPDGYMNLFAALEGPINNLTAKANLSSDSLRYRNECIHDIGVNMNFAQGALAFESFNALYRGYSIEGEGLSKNITGETSKDIYMTIIASNVSKPEDRFSVKLNGNVNPQKKEYYSDINIDIKDGFEQIVGEVSCVNNKIDYSLRNEYVALEGSAANVLKDTEITSTIHFSHFPVMKYLGFDEKDLFLDGKGTITGDFDKFIVDGGFRLLWGKNLNSLLIGNATFENILQQSRTFTVDAQLVDHHLRYSKPMSWDLSVKSDFHEIESIITESAEATLAVNLKPENGELSGRLDLEDFPLEWIIDIFVREEFSHRGKITGSVVIGGNIKEPYFITHEPLNVTELNLGGLNRLGGTVYVSGRPGELNFLDINLKRDEFYIMHADGRWKSGTPFILEAEGKNVALGAISDLISDTRKTSGNTDFSVTTVFTRNSGTIDGKFTVKDGYFFDIPFDTASGVLGGGSDGFRVTDFVIEKEDVFTGTGLAASGYLWRDNTEAPGLKMNLSLKGNLVCALPHLTGALKKASGECQADLTFGGSWQDPLVLDGELTVVNGTFEPSFLIDEFSDVDAVLKIDPGFETVSGLKAVRIIKASGVIDDNKLIVENVHPGDEVWEKIKRPELLSVADESINLDFGVLTGFIDSGKNREGSFKRNIPGFMAENETGIFELSGINGDTFLVGASDAGDYMTPYISGKILVHSGDINYPLLQATSESEKNAENNKTDPPARVVRRTGFLEDIFWDLEINNGSNVNYVKEKNLEIGKIAGTTLWQNEIKIDENSFFNVIGRISDDSFRVTGNARSTYGMVTYYGYRFDIEWAELELDTANVLKPAILTGRARTIVIDDSTGVETEIFLHVAFVDRESGKVTEARGIARDQIDDYYDLNRPQTRFDAGAIGIIEIWFTSNNPSDNTQEKILARLGISPGNIGAAATRALTAGIDNYYFNPILRPFEERIKRVFRLDMVKITPSFLGNFAQSQLGSSHSFDPSTDYLLFDRSRIMIAERLTKDWIITYIGQYGISRDFLYRKEKGFYHNIGLQYMVDRNIRFQLRYDYDEIIKREDKIIEFRYDFKFE